MNAFWSFFGLPLLAKELTEQSARKRTYVIRTVYATLLYGIAILIFWGNVYQQSGDPLDMLGQGREMLQVLVVLQIVGILLFVPALTCGAITAEKEANTFGLLLLTRLSPTTILLEKYLGRVFTMITFLLLSFPLIGFCYALGGVQQQDIWMSMLILVTLVFQLSALGTCCSAYFCTTVAAFIATYILGTLMFFGPILVFIFNQQAGRDIQRIYSGSVNQIVETTGATSIVAIENLNQLGGGAPLWPTTPQWTDYGAQSPDDVVLLFFPALTMFSDMFGNWQPMPVWMTVHKAIPAWMMTACLLLLARYFLVRRAFITPQNYVITLLRGIDRLFHGLNQRFTRGVVLVNDSQSLPLHEPVAWREVSRRSLGTFRYLLRTFLLIEVPILAIGLIALALPDFDSERRHPLFSVMSAVTWVIGLLLVIVKSSTIISGERSSETLSVLLSTPLSSREIVRQKLAGVRRLTLVVAAPILTVVLFQAWYIAMHGWSNSNYSSNAGDNLVDRNWLVFTIVQSLNVAILLPLIGWMALLIGLIMKTQTRAIFTALIVFAAWIVLPYVGAILASVALDPQGFESFALPFLLISPAILPILVEAAELGGFAHEINHSEATPYLIVICNLAAYFILYHLLRHITLWCAPYLLGRLESTASMPYRERSTNSASLLRRSNQRATEDI